MDHVPATYQEWLQVPEEEIIHVTNGEVWHDPSGRFTAVRETFRNHYPEPVRLRRIAHWCRYFSGMGTYALKRAILRSNAFYATTRFATAGELLSIGNFAAHDVVPIPFVDEEDGKILPKGQM